MDHPYKCEKPGGNRLAVSSFNKAQAGGTQVPGKEHRFLLSFCPFQCVFGAQWKELLLGKNSIHWPPSEKTTSNTQGSLKREEVTLRDRTVSTKEIAGPAFQLPSGNLAPWVHKGVGRKESSKPGGSGWQEKDWWDSLVLFPNSLGVPSLEARLERTPGASDPRREEP